MALAAQKLNKLGGLHREAAQTAWLVHKPALILPK
jgi:hypothetical protein